MLISDFLEPIERYERELRIANRRHDLVPVVLEDPAELELPDLGLVPMQDPETEDIVWVDTSIARLYPVEIFHLLGYRKLRRSGTELAMARRKFDLKPPRSIDLGGGGDTGTTGGQV